ncbi:THUMP domain-containing protein [Paraphoma chrysanthemicola]|nr:THUMP domain-containing protein [Paraphoma chrysanthemicola]
MDAPTNNGSAPKKRKAGPDDRDRNGGNKKVKGKNKWDMPRRGGQDSRVIQPGDTGIWATCAMKKEAKSVSDLRDLFQQYATKLYEPEQVDGEAADEGSDAEGEDIEAEIRKELADIRKPSAKPLFTSLKLDTQCLIFFKTRAPVEPVAFVEKICQDAAAGVQQPNCRFVKRLTPITAFDKANVKGLEAVAKQVLAPHFHGPDQAGKKFAIRPSIRNNTELTRDEVIKKVAAAVGPNHKVDLQGYDLLILVEIYKNVVGMSVVGPDFEKLKRFNLEELHQASQPKVEAPQVKDSATSAPIKITVDA